MFWAGQSYNLPRGKNQINLQGIVASDNIWQFLNIWKSSDLLQLSLSLPIQSISWAANVVTVTTVSPHGFYNGSGTQSGWNVSISGATPTAYNVSSGSCTITGASTLTFPLTLGADPGASSTGALAVTVYSTSMPNSPNSIFGQSNNYFQYLDVNGDVQPNIAGLTNILRIFYLAPINGGPYPAGYSRAGQSLTLDWTGDSTIAGGGIGSIGTGTGNSYSFPWQAGYENFNLSVIFNLSNPTQRANPPKNIRLYLTDNQTRINNAEIFEPVYLDMLRQGAGVIRLMDWMMTNNSTVLTVAGMATEAYRTWGWQDVSGLAAIPYGMPISVMTKLANAVNKHPWFTIPGMLGSKKFNYVTGMTRSLSAGATTVVKTKYAHSFVAGDTVVLYKVDGSGGYGATWGQQATVTINVGTATVTWPGHAFVKGQNVMFQGGDTLPSVAGQSANISARSFYVTNPNTGAGTFQLAATPALAQSNTVVSLTGTATGTITGFSQLNRNAFVVGPSSLTANTFELTNCDTTNFGATLPTVGTITMPFDATSVATEVANFAAAIKSQLNGQLVPRFEYTNEQWNGGTFDSFHALAAWSHNFTDASGNPIFPYDSNDGMYGYISAHVMKTVRDVYGGSGGRSKWRGVIATQTGAASVTSSVMVGVNNYVASAGLALSDLLNDIAVTGYYGTAFQGNGYVGTSWSNVTISIGTNAKVTLASGGSQRQIGTPIMFSTTGTLPTDAATGQSLKTWSVSTPPALSNNAGIYWTTSVDTGTGMTFTSSNNNGVLGPNVTTSGSQSGVQGYQTAYGSMITNWMNDSTALNTIDNGNYPTKYSFFNTMVNLEVKDGRFMATDFNVAKLQSIWLPHIVAGLGMVQYEGGNGNYTQPGATAANGTAMTSDAQTKEFFSHAFGTAEDAANWTGMVAAWQAFGVANSVATSYPSQFVDATNPNYSVQLLASFGANYYVDHLLGVGTGIPGNPLWNAIVNTN